MSVADVELVRRWFEGLERGDLTLEICHPQVEIRNWEDFPLRGPWVGHEGVRRWWTDIGEAFEGLQWKLLEVTDLGDAGVLTIQRFSGRFRLTGIDLELTWGSHITVCDGKIYSATGYASPRRARRAVGLPTG